MPKFSHRFPKAIYRLDENPDKIRSFAHIEDDPKRITRRNNLILAFMRGFGVFRGPPRHFTNNTGE